MHDGHREPQPAPGTETKQSFLTTEFWVYAAAVAVVAIATSDNNRKLRQSRVRGSSVIALQPRRCSPAQAASGLAAVGHEHVAEAPDRLDVGGLGGIGLDQLAKPRYLHIDRAVEDFVLAAAGEFHQFVARQRLA